MRTRRYEMDTLRNGALVDDLPEWDRFEISGRGTVLITIPLNNRAAMKGRTVQVGRQWVRVNGVENCLVIGHHTGECDKPTGLAVDFLDEDQIEAEQRRRLADEKFAATLGLSVPEARERYLEAILGLLGMPFDRLLWEHVAEHGCASGQGEFPTIKSCPEANMLFELAPTGYHVLYA